MKSRNLFGVHITHLFVALLFVLATVAMQSAWMLQASAAQSFGKIVYTADVSGQDRVFVMNADGTNRVQLTTDGGQDDTSPSFSPDGTKIVYAYNGYVFVMNADGTGASNITPTGVTGALHPAFSPNAFTGTGYQPGNPPVVTVTEDLSSRNYFVKNYILVVGEGGSVGNVTVASGGILKGTGTIGVLIVQPGGVVAPGNSPGCLNAGNTTLAGTYEVELGGKTACTEHDQLKVTGTVNVTGGKLDVKLHNNFVPKAGDSFVIMENDGTDAVVGTLEGLAEGATFTKDGVTYSVSYTGGDGNDVVLTVTAVDESLVGANAPGTPKTGLALIAANPLLTLALTAISGTALYALSRKVNSGSRR